MIYQEYLWLLIIVLVAQQLTNISIFIITRLLGDHKADTVCCYKLNYNT